MNNKHNRIHHDFLWSTLVHFMTNWSFEEGNTIGGNDPTRVWMSPASSKMRFDFSVYRKYLDELKASGTNTLIIDVGDALKYKSHPEIAVEGAFTPNELSKEHLLGFMQTTWAPCLNEWQHMLDKGNAATADAIAAFKAKINS